MSPTDFYWLISRANPNLPFACLTATGTWSVAPADWLQCPTLTALNFIAVDMFNLLAGVDYLPLASTELDE